MRGLAGRARPCRGEDRGITERRTERGGRDVAAHAIAIEQRRRERGRTHEPQLAALREELAERWQRQRARAGEVARPARHAVGGRDLDAIRIATRPLILPVARAIATSDVPLSFGSATITESPVHASIDITAPIGTAHISFGPPAASATRWSLPSPPIANSSRPASPQLASTSVGTTPAGSFTLASSSPVVASRTLVTPSPTTATRSSVIARNTESVCHAGLPSSVTARMPFASAHTTTLSVTPTIGPVQSFVSRHATRPRSISTSSIADAPSTAP
jgi:hypothetical protein